jgi:hypothetical protein
MTPDQMLEKVLAKPNLRRAERTTALRYLKMWHGNVIPPLSKIRELYNIAEQSLNCKRLRGDGSCLWLRDNAESVGLRALQPGESARCNRMNTKTAKEGFEGCKGFIREK